MGDTWEELSLRSLRSLWLQVVRKASLIEKHGIDPLVADLEWGVAATSSLRPTG
jgi:hypothetical protein